MAFTDLRTFIDGAARIGELKVIDGAHWNLEIGCLTELMAEQEGPLLLFDKIVDYPASYHNKAGGFSFADGHSEIKKWQDGRTAPNISKADRPLDVTSANNKDVFWMQERSTRMSGP